MSKDARRKVHANGARVVHRRARITTTGVAGSASGSEYISLPAGIIRAVAVDWNASAPATSDLTIKADSSTGTTVFSTANSVTDIAAKPVGMPGIDETGAALAVGGTDSAAGGFPFRYGLHIAVAQADALTDCVIVDVWVEIVRFEQITLIADSGADGAAVSARTLDINGAGFVQALAVTYANQPVTIDLTIKADDSTGATIFSTANSNTNIAATPVGMPGMDEGGAALAPTDASAGGFPVKRGVYAAFAQGDAYTSANESVLVELWIAQ